jgi:hypothetical protein
MSLRRRIKTLEGRCPRPRLRPEDCPRKLITALIIAGDPLPEPADLPACPSCGHAHVLVEKLVVIEPAEAAPCASALQPQRPGRQG